VDALANGNVTLDHALTRAHDEQALGLRMPSIGSCPHRKCPTVTRPCERCIADLRYHAGQRDLGGRVEFHAHLDAAKGTQDDRELAARSRHYLSQLPRIVRLWIGASGHATQDVEGIPALRDGPLEESIHCVPMLCCRLAHLQALHLTRGAVHCPQFIDLAVTATLLANAHKDGSLVGRTTNGRLWGSCRHAVACRACSNTRPYTIRDDAPSAT
jgi:hypothetical protein